jgi:hypothetical protein
MGNRYADAETGESGGENLHLIIAGGHILKRNSAISGGRGGVESGSVVLEQRHFRSGHGGGLRVDHFDFEFGSRSGCYEGEYEKYDAKYTHTILLCTRKGLRQTVCAGLLARE